MQTIKLYRYIRLDGGVTVSPIEPDVDYTILYRLVADEGKTLTQDNVDFRECVDTNAIDGWLETTG